MATSSEKDKIIKLSTAEYTTLSTTGTLTKDGVTYTYSPSDTIYVTPDAISGLSEYKEQLRLICNRYLDSTDRLPIDCTWEELIAVFNEYDEYSYMNAFLNSIEVFPDKDYSINDTEGHIKGLRNYAFYNNTALKSVFLRNYQSTLDSSVFTGATNLEYVTLIGEILFSGHRLFNGGIFKKIILKGYTNMNPSDSYYNFNNCGMLKHLSMIDTLSANYGRRTFVNLINLKTLLLTNFPSLTANETQFLYDGATNPDAIIIVRSDSVSALDSTADLLNSSMTSIIYVPSVLLSDYQSATNWTAVNAERPIQDIESNLSALRTLGADFSFTQYANKKWGNGVLVTDSTIGEEVDD